MSRKYDGPVIRTFIQFFHENGAHMLESGDDMLIVDDFVADIDRRTPFGQSLFNNLNGAIDPGAKPARCGEKDCERLHDLTVSS